MNPQQGVWGAIESGRPQEDGRGPSWQGWPQSGSGMSHTPECHNMRAAAQGLAGHHCNLLLLFYFNGYNVLISTQEFSCFHPSDSLSSPPSILLRGQWKAAVWCMDFDWGKTWHGFTGLQWLVKLMLWLLPALLRQDSHKWWKSAGSNNTLWFLPSYGENDFISSSWTKGNDSSQF